MGFDESYRINQKPEFAWEINKEQSYFSNEVTQIVFDNDDGEIGTLQDIGIHKRTYKVTKAWCYFNNYNC